MLPYQDNRPVTNHHDSRQEAVYKPQYIVLPSTSFTDTQTRIIESATSLLTTREQSVYSGVIAIWAELE